MVDTLVPNKPTSYLGSAGTILNCISARVLLEDGTCINIGELQKVGGDGIAIGNGLQRDAFGYLRTSQKHPRTEYKQIHSRHPTLMQERLWGCIIEHGTITGTFNVGDTFDDDEKHVCTVTAVGSGNITYDCKGGNQFADGSTLTILSGIGIGSTATITTHNTGADLVYNYDRSSSYLKCGTVAGQRAVRQTSRYLQYTSGDSDKFIVTGVLPPVKDNQEVYIMKGDDLNGYGFAYKVNESAVREFGVLIRTSTSGTPVDEFVGISEWNIDNFGQGDKNPSGLTLDTTKINIYDGDIEWLGAGSARLNLNINGKSFAAHQFNNANELDVVYMKTASLPIRYEIVNTGTVASDSNFEMVCFTVQVEGSGVIFGNEYTVDIGNVTKTIGNTEENVFMVRLKANYPTGEPNRQTMQLLDSGLTTETNNSYIRSKHLHQLKSFVGTFTDAQAPDGSIIPGVEVCTDCTSYTTFHMHVLQASKAFAGQAGKGGETLINPNIISNHSFASQNFESDNSEVFAFDAESESPSGSLIWGHVTFLLSE